MMHRLGKGEKSEEVPSRWQKPLEYEAVNKYSSVVFDVTPNSFSALTVL
jgi:hypothetical protein